MRATHDPPLVPRKGCASCNSFYQRVANVEKPLRSDGLDIGMSSYGIAADCLRFVRRVKYSG